MLALLLTVCALIPGSDFPLTPSQLMELGRAKQVVRDYDSSEATHEGAPHYAAIIAQANFETGHEERAREILSRFPARKHLNCDVALARIEIATDHLEQAWSLLIDEQSATRPHHAQSSTAWFLLGRVAFRRGDARRARPFLERALKLSPHDSDAISAWHMLGNEARERRDVQRARECFGNSAKIRGWHELYRARRIQAHEHPDDPLPRYGIGLMWMELGELEQAQQAFLQAILPAEYVPAIQMLAEVQRQMGELSKALHNFGAALKRDPNLPLARAQRGAMHAEAGRWAEAAADLDVFSGLPEASRKEFLIAHWHHARALDALGRTAQALEAFKRYQALGGTRPRAR